MATIFVPGAPIPEGSTTTYVTAGGKAVTTHANRALRPWRAEIHMVARQATPPGAITYPTGPVTIRVWFLMPRTKSEPKRTRPHIRRPDLDKLIRGILDALTGVVYADDSQVHHILAHKRTADIGEQPGAVIEWDSP